MKHLYRAHTLTRRTRVYGVNGDPSAILFSVVTQHGIRVAPRGMPSISRSWCATVIFLSLFRSSASAVSAYLPHKAGHPQALKECRAASGRNPAVRVVVRNDRVAYGCNTDYIGVLRALEKKAPNQREPCANLWASWIGAAPLRLRSLVPAPVVGICARRRKRQRTARAGGREK